MSGTGNASDLRARVVEAIKTVHDPEIPVNLYDLGLIYELDISEGGDVHVNMTLTTPNCPVAESMPAQVRDAVLEVEGVNDVKVDLVWEPRWTREMMTEDGKLHLEFMGIDWKDPLPSGGVTDVTIGRRKSSAARRDDTGSH